MFEDLNILSGVSARVSIAQDYAARLEQYSRGWAAYLGQQPDTLKPDPKTNVDHNVKINYPKLVVDAGVTSLFGQEPIWETEVKGKAGEERQVSKATEYLDTVWADNKKMIFLQKTAQNGGVCGHCFVRILKPKIGGKYPRLINMSPEYVRVVVDPEDIDEVRAYIIEYEAVDEQGRNISVRTRIARYGAVWEIVDETRRGTKESPPSSTANPETRREVWPYDWPPMIDCQNLPLANSYYGMSDIEADVLDLGNAINFIASNIRRIIYYHAHPKMWGSGFTTSDVPSDPSTMLIFSNPQATLNNLEMTGDLSSSMAFYELLQGAFFDTARLPAVATGQLDKAGDLSGTAMQIAYRPLTSMIDQKRLTYGEMLTELNKRLLEMGGFANSEPIAIQWPEILPVNTLEERQVALIDQQLGVSQDTLLWKFGYDAEQEAEKKQQEQDAEMEQQAKMFDAGVGDAAGAYGNEQGRSANGSVDRGNRGAVARSAP